MIEVKTGEKIILKIGLNKFKFNEKYFFLVKKNKSKKEINQEEIVVAIGIIINPILLKK